jgi:hypothetical protein
MKKIVFMALTIMFPTFMLADYQFIVENSTMVSTYFNIFNAISSLLSSKDYVDLLRLAFLLGGFFVFASSVLRSWEGSAGTNLIASYGKYLAIGVAMLTMVFSYKETMWVSTKNLPSFCSTESNTVGFAVELPSILGYVFSSTNALGKNLTELAETAFSEPSSTGTASMTDSDGYLGSLKETIKLLSYNPNNVLLKKDTYSENSDFMSLWSSFFNTCVYSVANNKGQDGYKVLNSMTSSDNLYEWTRNYLNYVYEGTSKKAGEYLIEYNGKTVYCDTYFNYLEESINELRNNYSCAFPLSHGGVLELLTGSTGGTASKLNEIAIQSGLINALSASKSVNSVGISGANFANGKSRAESNQQNLASAQYMAQMLPFIQMTMRAILYAFFPFVFVVMLLPGGVKVLTQYTQTMIWIELWGPTAAIVNMFVNLQVKDKLGKEFTETGLTYMSSVDMLTDANTIAGVGAMLYLSIPALTWLILKGSGQMLGNVAGGVMGTFTKNLDSKTIAQDNAQLKASSKSGMSISETINQLEQSQATNQYAQAMGWRNAGGMDKMLDVKTKQAEGQNKFDIANVLSQNNYVSNQATLGEQKGANDSGNVDGYNNGGGFNATQAQAKIQTETGLKTTIKNIQDAGGASNVANNKSDIENKEFNKLIKINEGTTKDEYRNIGEKDASVMSGTSAVVEKMGAGAYKDSTIQEELTKTLSAEKNKNYTGSNENVAKVNSSMAVKEIAKKIEIDKKTTIGNFADTGSLEGSNIKATSNVVQEKGTTGFEASKEQQLRTENNSALEKQRVSGSNENVAKIDTDKNVSDFKTNKKVFEQFSTDSVSTAQSENQKENIVKTLETKSGIEAKGIDTKDFYNSEAKMTVEDRKANLSKADKNNDGTVNPTEANLYGKTMKEKVISDQSSLEFKHQRLLENAEKFANSKNKDVRDTYNKAYNENKAFGEEAAMKAGAKAVQESIATKEQQITTDEKSSYVDGMQNNGLDGTEKGNSQVQKDAENISKTNSEIASYAQFTNEKMSGTESYKQVEDNYFNKFKSAGQSDEQARILAKNATLAAHATNGFKQEEYTKDVLNHNLSNIDNKMNSKLEQKAYEKGILTKDDFNLVSREKALKEQIAGLESKKNKYGAYEPSVSMSLQLAKKKLTNTQEELKDVRANLETFAKIDKDGQKIVNDRNKEIATTISNMEKLGVIKTEEGQIKFATSTVNYDINNLTEKQKGELRIIKGNLEGNELNTTGSDGRKYQIITDISGSKITNYSSAKMGFENISADKYDKGYVFSELTDGKYMKEQAIGASIKDNLAKPIQALIFKK